MAKDFFNIADMTDDYKVSLENKTTRDGVTNQDLNCWALCWQVKVQLAIAQQLSVISGHLGKLVEMCEKQSSK